VRELRFVFDLDGTIVFHGQPISDTIQRALQELAAYEHEIIFASARPIRDMLPVINEALQRYSMIGGNGSLIVKKYLAGAKSFRMPVAAWYFLCLTRMYGKLYS